MWLIENALVLYYTSVLSAAQNLLQKEPVDFEKAVNINFA